MTVTTRRTATHTYEADDGRRFDLPIVDPYDNEIIEDSIQVVHHVGGTQIRYVLHDEYGADHFDQDEIFHGWEDVHVLHSQRDANALSDLLNECDHCGTHVTDHGEEGDEDWTGVWDHDWVKPAAAVALDEGRAFLFERYEHGQVRYALRGESSMIDRQWDVTPIAGFMRADDEWGDDLNLEDMARATLDRYTDWCNGNVFLHVYVDFDAVVDDGVFQYQDYEVIGGYLGYEEAKENL